MPYRFFYAYQITRLGRSSKNSFNLKGKSNRANVDAGRLKSRKCNMNVLLLAFDKEVETDVSLFDSFRIYGTKQP
jgi:hypothetical protein